MLKIALTGSISSGKTYALSFFNQCKIPVFSFDKEVGVLLERDKGVLKDILEAFPSAVRDNRVDRKKLVDIAFNNQKLLRQLENILYPKAFELHALFLKRNKIKNTKMVVVEIPLLFEKRLEKLYDVIVMVSCTKYLQSKWAMQREGMTKNRFDAITRNQLPDIKKREFVEYIIFSGTGDVRRQVIGLVRMLSKCEK